MGKKESLALKSGNEVYKSYRNNTDQKWIRDPGLRKLNMGLAFMFSSAAANGMHTLFPSIHYVSSTSSTTRLGLVPLDSSRNYQLELLLDALQTDQLIHDRI